MDNIFIILPLIGIGLFSAIKVLQSPYLGIVFTAASLPIIDLLPPIPYFTSLIPLVGVVTLFGYILQMVKNYRDSLFYFGNVHIWGLIFVWWIVFSNFKAAWFGATRNWFFTYGQLWVMAILATQLLDTPKKHRVFMGVFSFVSIISALLAILEGRIGYSIETSLRSAGFAGNANEAARYFIVGLVFLNYLRGVVDSRILSNLTFTGMIIAFLGVFFTLSRTGILLLLSMFGLMLLLDPDRETKMSFIIIFIIGFFLIFFVEESFLNIVRSIIPTIIQGSDTLGLRYKFWWAGWQMWKDNPLSGVGIGQYREVLKYYARGLLPETILRSATHNLYVNVLAETGSVGFLVYFFMLLSALRNFWVAENITSLRTVWLLAFLVMLLGGVTMSSQYDKLLWFCVGISMCFSKQYESSVLTQSKEVLQQARI